MVLFLILLFSSTLSGFGQVKITGIVQSQDKRPLSYASVILNTMADSSTVASVVANKAGVFTLKNLPINNYWISITCSGYKKNSFSILLSATDKQCNLGIVHLERADSSLNNIVVVKSKPLYEQHLDKLVMNVQSSIISSGSSLLEVLERTPGVDVNRQQFTISLNGKTDVLILIDGKAYQQPMMVILQMLAGMSASNVDKIEVYVNPPSKFDAGGNGGIINILLKKRTKVGTNGTLTSMIGWGKHEKSNVTGLFNHRGKRINWFSDFSYYYNHTTEYYTNYRDVIFSSKHITTETVTKRYPKYVNANARFGFDFSINPRTKIGITTSGYSNKWHMTANNIAIIKGDSIQSSFIAINSSEVNHWRNITESFYINHKFADSQSVNFNVDYLYFRNDNPTSYQNNYQDDQNRLIKKRLIRANKSTPIGVLASNLDFQMNLGRIKWEYGAKVSFSNLMNNVLVDSLSSNQWLKDSSLSNLIQLKENIAATYSSATWKVNNTTSLNLGLRYEYTYMNLKDRRQNNLIIRKYGNLFPSIFLSKDITKDNVIQLSYGRRIGRPSYRDLAPLFVFLDPTTYFFGNDSIKASINDNYKLDYRYKQFLFSFQFSHVKDAISTYEPLVLPGTNEQLFTSLNLKYLNTYVFSATLPIRVTNWWQSQLTVMGVNQKLQTEQFKNNVRLWQSYVRVNGTETFPITKTVTGELSGFYQSKKLLGINSMSPYGVLNIAVQKKLGKNNNVIRISISDLFNSSIDDEYVRIPEDLLNIHSYFKYETRQVKLTYICNLGNSKIGKKNYKDRTSEEIKSRLN
ncbi:MAG: outer membrane beta-barrel protein [Ginsengibacter sp.]